MIRYSHSFGSPWHYASTRDGGFWVGICEHPGGRYRVYTATTKDDLQTGDGFHCATETNLKRAKQYGRNKIAAMD